MIVSNELVIRCDLYAAYMVYVERKQLQLNYDFDINILLNIKAITDVPMNVADQCSFFVVPS